MRYLVSDNKSALFHHQNQQNSPKRSAIPFLILLVLSGAVFAGESEESTDFFTLDEPEESFTLDDDSDPFSLDDSSDPFALDDSSDPFALDDTNETVPVHPGKQACMNCHALRKLPLIDGAILAGSVHADQSCDGCHEAAMPAETNCSLCHRSSNKALLRGAHSQKGERGADVPNCVNCHDSHNVVRTESAAFAEVISERCAVCHEERYDSYMDRFHGKAAKLGMLKAPRCQDCHSPHSPLPQSNPESRVSRDNLVSTCGQCHENANENFTKFDPHPQPDNKDRSPLIYYIKLAMEALIIGVFGFFTIHTILWLQRSAVASLRNEFPNVQPTSARGEQWVRRFSAFDSLMHVIVIISFMLLAMTGLPLLYATEPAAQFLAELLGGQPWMRRIHLVCGAITFGYLFIHLVAVFLRFVNTRDIRLFYGSDSLVPSLQDLRDFSNNLAWFFYQKPYPKLGRWTYWEKFDYWAVFWGVGMIGISGAMLAYPDITARLLPGQVLNVAAVIHGEEALLAVGFIFVFHFFHNHLRPENFPMDTTIFTGRLTLERFKHERSTQYEELVAEGKLEEMLVPPPPRELVITATIFGWLVVSIGLVLIITVFWTMLTSS